MNLDETSKKLLDFERICCQTDAKALESAILVKNLVKSKDFPSELKQHAKEILLRALGASSGLVRLQVLHAIGIVLDQEPRKGLWPEFLPKVSQLIQNSTDIPGVCAGLMALLELVKVYQWLQIGKRGPMLEIISSLFPQMLNMATSLVSMDSDHPDALLIIKTVVKIYNHSIRMELPKLLQEQSSLVGWGSLFLSVIQRQPPASLAPSLAAMDPDAREKHMLWKAKKWAYCCVNSLFIRYSQSRRKEPKYKQYSQAFIANFVPRILQVYLTQIDQMQSVWLAPRSQQLIATFLERAIGCTQIWPLILQHLDLIVARFIFPTLCFTNEDQELWDNDQVEYIHKKIDPPVDDYKSPVNACEELLIAICKDKFKEAFMPTVQLITPLLNSQTPREKYGALKMMCCLASTAQNDESPIKTQLEQMMAAHVYPEFKSPLGYMRARACHCVYFFDKFEYSNDANLKTSFDGILSCIKDSDLPVKVLASLALTTFLDYPQVKEFIKPHVAGVMQDLLNLTNDIDMDTLTEVMEKLVFQFSEQLMPFAVSLCTQLVGTFLRMVQDATFNSDDMEHFETKTMACMGLLKTISSLILAVETSLEITTQLQSAVHPAISFVLENNICDLYEEVFEIVEMTTYCTKTITTPMWDLLPKILQIFKNDGLEYFEEIYNSLDNYITFGGTEISSSPVILQQLLDVIKEVMNPANDTRSSDKLRACMLMECMMLNMRGRIDGLVPTFIQIAHVCLSKQTTSVALRVHYLEIISNALFYDPRTTVNLLVQMNYLGDFLNTWFANLDYFTRVHDLKLNICALGAIILMPLDPSPVSSQIEQAYWHLFDGLLKLIKVYPTALEARETLKKQDEEGEGDGYDDFGDDDINGGYDTEGDDASVLEESDGDETQVMDAASVNVTNEIIDQDDYDDDGDDDWSLAEAMDEDIFFTTPLDQVNPNSVLKQIIEHFASVPTRMQQLEASMTPEKRVLIETALGKA